MRSFTIVDVPQRSPEWFAARLGRLTGSRAGDMLAKIKSGESAARRNLRLQLVLERLTGKPQESEYVSPAMQAGIDREADAFAAYEALTGNVAWRTGFLQHTDWMLGCSLDGHVGDFERLVSLKCRQPAAHWEFLRTGTIPASALAQIRHELMMVPTAEAHDYFSWNPDFPPELRARVVTLKRADVDVPGYEREAVAFLEEVNRELLAVATLANPAAQLSASVA